MRESTLAIVHTYCTMPDKWLIDVFGEIVILAFLSNIAIFSLVLFLETGKMLTRFVKLGIPPFFRQHPKQTGERRNGKINHLGLS